MRKLTKTKYLLASLILIPIFAGQITALADQEQATPQESALVAMAEKRTNFSPFGQADEAQNESINHTMIFSYGLMSQTNPDSQKDPETQATKTNIPAVPVSQKMRVLVTAYSSTVDQCDSSPFITAMGTHVRDGIVAANWLPFGTRIRLPEFSGDKVYVVEDRMAKRNSYKIDIWMESRQAALTFGVRTLAVEVLN